MAIGLGMSALLSPINVMPGLVPGIHVLLCTK
jgi:hypothetical protein